MSPSYIVPATTGSKVVLSELGQMFAAPVIVCADWAVFDFMLVGYTP